MAIRSRIAGELRAMWDADELPAAEAVLAVLVDGYRRFAPRLTEWIEKNVPDGLAVFTLPRTHRRRLRTTNLIERLNQEDAGARRWCASS